MDSSLSYAFVSAVISSPFAIFLHWTASSSYLCSLRSSPTEVVLSFWTFAMVSLGEVQFSSWSSVDFYLFCWFADHALNNRDLSCLIFQKKFRCILVPLWYQIAPLHSYRWFPTLIFLFWTLACDTPGRYGWVWICFRWSSIVNENTTRIVVVPEKEMKRSSSEHEDDYRTLRFLWKWVKLEDSSFKAYIEVHSIARLRCNSSAKIQLPFD